MRVGAFNNTFSHIYKNSQSGKEDALAKKSGQDKNKINKSVNDLNPNQLALLRKLQARDTEVRAHEAAHQAAGGGLTGGATFTYQRGPDGKMYAIGGEVPITIKGGSTPEEKIANARQVEAAALAPARPSPQDYAVASKAKMMEIQAQQELLKEKMAENEGKKYYGSLDDGNFQEDKKIDTIA